MQWHTPSAGTGCAPRRSRVDYSEEVAFERGTLRAPALGHHIEHWFGIVTIVLIAAAVFLSATIGWGYSVANTHADTEAEEARNSAAEMVDRHALFSARQSELVWALGTITEQRMRLGLANQRVRLSRFDESIKSGHDDEEKRHLRELRDYLPNVPRPIGLGMIMGYENFNIDDDPRFPNRLLWQFARVPVMNGPPKDEQERVWRKEDEHTRRSHNAYEAFAEWESKRARAALGAGLLPNSWRHSRSSLSRSIS